MKTLIVQILKALAGSLISWKFILFGLRTGAKQTTNLIDDNIVEIVAAAKDNDSEKILLYSQRLVEETLKAVNKKGA